MEVQGRVAKRRRRAPKSGSFGCLEVKKKILDILLMEVSYLDGIPRSCMGILHTIFVSALSSVLVKVRREFATSRISHNYKGVSLHLLMRYTIFNLFLNYN